MKKLYLQILSTILTLSLCITSLPAFAVSLNDDAVFVESPEEAELSEDLSVTLDDVYIAAEDESKRGEFEKHYLLSDGTFVAVSYPEAVHYSDENGVWQDVDNEIAYQSSSSRYVTGNEMFAASFASRADQSELISLSQGEHTLSWSLVGISKNVTGTSVRHEMSSVVSNLTESATLDVTLSANEATASLNERKLVSDVDAFDLQKMSGKIAYDTLFADAPEISVDYTVFHNKIEEDIYINAPTDLRSFAMNVNAGVLTAVKKDDGSVEFLDANGELQYRVGIPYMVDAAENVLNDIEVAVIQKGSQCVITYTPNEEWLTSEDRVYPLMLDPSITTKEYNSNIVDTYVYEGNTANHSAEQKLYYGVMSGKVYRTYIKISNLPNIDASMPILNATMQLTFLSGTTTGKTAEVYKVTSSWNPASITYANQPGVYSVNRLATCPYNSTLSYLTFDLTENIAALYDEFAAANNYGYVIKYADESTTNPDYNVFCSSESTATAKRPVITVNYGYALPSSLTNGEIYTFQNCGSFSYMTVHNGNDANDVNVYQQAVLSASDLTSKHKFKLEYVPSTGGYYLRAMCSSNGTGRVLDIVKSKGYVNNGGNVQIYSANDALAQHWFIIGLGGTRFKIVPRTNMSLALTAYSDGDGSTAGTTAVATGNIFVSTYNASNDYQKWIIRDEEGAQKTSTTQTLKNATYYLNNNSYGKYLHKASDSTVNAMAGLIASLGDTIRWRITHIEGNQYTIQSADDLSRYLYMGSSTSVSLSTTTNISENYLWTISTAIGGGILIKNVATQRYLKQTGPFSVSTVTSLGTVGTATYNECAWRLASTDYYGNTTDNIYQELTDSFSLQNAVFYCQEDTQIQIQKSPSNALWSSANDFTYEYWGGDLSAFEIFQTKQSISALHYGDAQIYVIHNVTGIAKVFDISLRYKNEYTNLLIEDFKFDYENALLISRLYSALESTNNNLSTIDISWRFSRLLGGMVYEGDFVDDLKWIDVAGNPINVYSGVVPISNQEYFTEYLGYTDLEYHNLKQALMDQHEQSNSEKNYGDFAHMQISLSARLAYYLEEDYVGANILLGTDLEVSYYAGWLGDAALDIDGAALVLNNDDYIADLDAENIYQAIIASPEDGIMQTTVDYYATLTAANNRAVMFKQHIPYNTVEDIILEKLFGNDYIYDECWVAMETDDYYTAPYNFLISLQNNCAELQNWRD